MDLRLPGNVGVGEGQKGRRPQAGVGEGPACIHMHTHAPIAHTQVCKYTHMNIYVQRDTQSRTQVPAHILRIDHKCAVMHA